MKIIIFDTETTGLPKSRQSIVTNTLEWPHIVQFSYLIYDMDTHHVDKISDSIIKLDKDIDIPEESSKIHGITKQKSDEYGIELKDVINLFMEDLQECELLVAHNMEFDMNMIIVELIRMNKYAELMNDDESYNLNNDNYEKIINIAKYCTMVETEKMCDIRAISKNGKQYTKFPTLGELHYYLFKCYPKKLHNSLNDIVICFRCYHKLITKKDIENEEIVEMLKLLL